MLNNGKLNNMHNYARILISLFNLFLNRIRALWHCLFNLANNSTMQPPDLIIFLTRVLN
jgi:hypothetical protein